MKPVLEAAMDVKELVLSKKVSDLIRSSQPHGDSFFIPGGLSEDEMAALAPHLMKRDFLPAISPPCLPPFCCHFPARY